MILLQVFESRGQIFRIERSPFVLEFLTSSVVIGKKGSWCSKAMSMATLTSVLLTYRPTDLLHRTSLPVSPDRTMWSPWQWHHWNFFFHNLYLRDFIFSLVCIGIALRNRIGGGGLRGGFKALWPQTPEISHALISSPAYFILLLIEMGTGGGGKRDMFM